MKTIIILNGFATSGKGVFADIIYKISGDLLTYEYSSIDYIKQIAKKNFSWDGKKDAKGRKLLSDLKKIAITHGNIPFKKVIKTEEVISVIEDEFIYVVDVREPEEIQKLVDYYHTKIGYKVMTVLIKRNEVMNKKQSNPSDGENILDYNYDFVLYNNESLKEFEEVVTEFYNERIKDGRNK